MTLQIPIFVLAGQSNIAFGGIDNRLYELASGTGSNFDMVKVARGGTSLFAAAGQDWDPASGELYSQLVSAVKAAEDKVTKAGYEPVVYTLWVQGESDMGNARYGDQLTNFITHYRSDIGQADSNFTISLLPYANVVRSGEISTSNTLRNVTTIDPRDVKTWDGIHYTKPTRDHIAEDFFASTHTAITNGSGYINDLDRADIYRNGTGFHVKSPSFVDFHYTQTSAPVYLYSFSGDDVITTGKFNDTIYTNDNNDWVSSGAGNDFIDLGPHDDTAYAGPGDDTVIGGTGNDRLFGQDGNDWLQGMAQDDVLCGGNGNDRLDGGSGNDRVNGDAGNDSITGGPGADILAGGTGADTFYYSSADFAGTALANRDTILDFSSAQGDRIDLSAVDANSTNTSGDDAFVYIGAAEFSKTPGELRFQVTGANGLLSGDLNGDGIADFIICLKSVTDLQAHDLIL